MRWTDRPVQDSPIGGAVKFPAECEAKGCAVGARLVEGQLEIYHNGETRRGPDVSAWSVGLWVNTFHPAMRIDLDWPDECRTRGCVRDLAHDFATNTLATRHNGQATDIAIDGRTKDIVAVELHALVESWHALEDRERREAEEQTTADRLIAEAPAEEDADGG